MVVRQLLSEFPSIASELMTLLQMLDDGEVAVIGGIANTRIRKQLKTLFPLLGLTKVRCRSRAAERAAASNLFSY